MYPVLKYNIRLKAFTKFCWVYAPGSEINKPIPQYAAFILTLMDGQWAKDDLKLILATVYDSNEKLCSKLVDEVIKEYDDCIEWHRQKGKVQLRYNSQDFLFNGLKDVNVNKRLETPNTLALTITRACNFRCIYCFNSSGSRSPGELTGEEWCNLIEQARELGVFLVYVSGGEPTTHPDLPMILQKIKKLDLDFKLFTNGYYLTDKICELLVGNDVQVSLDTANKETHYLLTNTDTFDIVIKNIKRLVENKTHVTVKSVISKLNTEELPELYRLCKELGVESLTLDKFDISSSGRGEVDMRIDENDIERLKKICSELESSQTKLLFGLSNDIWTTSDNIVSCGAFLNSMLISAQGDLIACEKMLDVPEMTFGNIKNNTLAELWESPKINEFINNIYNTNDEKCRKCGLFAKCRTGCFAIKHYFRKPIFSADPRCSLDIPKE
jgi:pyrroloquinoline quinone biosynthesis protein E